VDASTGTTKGSAVDRIPRIPPLGFAGSIAIFGVGALLLFVATRVVIPALVSATGAERVVMWFVAASSVVFSPLLLCAALLLRRERRTVEGWAWRARLRLRPMDRGDWLVNGGAWLLFQAAFSWRVLVTLLPIVLILPAIAQHRRSTWPGVIIHTAFGVVGFLTLALGSCDWTPRSMIINARREVAPASCR